MGGAVMDPIITFSKAKKALDLAQGVVDGAIDTGVLQTNINQKLSALETQYAPRLTTAESQLADKASKSETRLKSEKLAMEDMSDTVISAITGGTTVNVLSIPQNDSVTPDKLSANLRQTLNIDKSWNEYNKLNALDGKLVGYTPNTTLSPYADAIYSGLVPVVSGKTYVISQKLRSIGAVFFYDGTVSAPNFNTGAVCAVVEGAGGAYGSWASPDGKVTRTNKSVDSEGYYVSVITIIDPNIKFMAWHMHSGSYWTHTTAQFNELIDSAQVEEGTLRTQYTTFGWENYKIKEDALPDQFKQLQNNHIVVLKKGSDITGRVNFSETKDFYHLWKYPKTNMNLGLNLEGIYTCDKNTPYNVISGDLYKNSGDDITPLYINESYMGANHGYFDLITLTATAHGKTTADIGSVWNLTGGTKRFIIVDIVDANKLKIFSDYTGNPTLPTHYTSAASFSGTLTHVSGATNLTDITFASTVKDQLFPNTNNKSVKFVLDGKEITEDGTFYGDKFDIIETYNILDIPSVQQYLKDHIGTKANLSDNTILGWVTVTNIFSHGRNGSLTVKTGYEFLKQTNISFYGIVQSVTVGTKAYVPGVGMVDGKDMGTVVTQGTNTLEFAKATWLDGTKPPYRYHQFNDDYSKGMALGYNTQFGVAKPSIRQNNSSAGNFAGSSKKMYPHVKVGGTATLGDYQEAVAFRVPLKTIDADATCLYWYWVGEDIYLAFDYHKSINKIIELPSYMAGKKIEQLDVHANTTIQSEFVSAKGIKVKVVNNYGYGVLRLYN